MPNKFLHVDYKYLKFVPLDVNKIYNGTHTCIEYRQCASGFQRIKENNLRTFPANLSVFQPLQRQWNHKRLWLFSFSFHPRPTSMFCTSLPNQMCVRSLKHEINCSMCIVYDYWVVSSTCVKWCREFFFRLWLIHAALRPRISCYFIHIFGKFIITRHMPSIYTFLSANR